MKKMFISVLALLLCLCVLSACGTPSVADTADDVSTPSDVVPPEEPAAVGGFVVGSWTTPDDPTVSDGLRAHVAHATEGLLGVEYEPIALLGKQTVAGANYTVLCSARSVGPEARPYYAVLIVYVDHDGKEELLSTTSLTPNYEIDKDAATAGPLAGGWSVPEDQSAGLEAFGKAVEGMVGAEHKPICVLGEQVVAGMNYCLLCRSVGVYPGAEVYYTVIYVYRDLEGNASVTDIVSLDTNARPVYPDDITD